MTIKSLTRTELYELVWQKPITHIAKEFELSDNGVAKVCKKYNIPRPERGYWSKVAAGYVLKKTPLPKGKNVQIVFDLEEGKRRRAIHQAEVERKNETKAVLEQTQENQPLEHRLGEVVSGFFETCRQDEYNRVVIERKSAPRITASKSLKQRVVQFVAGLAWTLEKNGIELKNGEEGIQFTNGKDVLYLSIEEYLDTYTKEPDQEERNQPRWTWKTTEERPSGKLRIQISSPTETRGRCKWTETKHKDALTHLPDIAAGMLAQFEYFDDQREEEHRRKEKRAEEEREYNKKREWRFHCERLQDELMKRQINLMRAAENFKHAQDIENLVKACVEKWGGLNKLSFEQKAWVDYASKVSQKLNPLNDDYPNPVRDRAFDPTRIPVGGPYPDSEDIPLPYALLEIQGMLKHH